MAKGRYDSSQGTAPNAAQPIGAASSVAKPNTKALMRADQRALNAADRAQTTPRPSSERTSQGRG